MKDKKQDAILEITLIFLLAVLFCQRILVLDDGVFPAAGEFVESLIPQAYYRDSLLEHHQIPLWDNFLSPGFPYVTLNTFHNFISTPPVLLFGEVLGAKILMFLSVFFSGLGMWYFARRVLGVNAPSRLLAASTYMLSGFFVVNAFNIAKIHRMLGAAIIPYALTFLWLSVEKKGIKYKILTAVSMALFVFSGSNYFFQYFFFVFLLFALLKSFTLKGAGLSGLRPNPEHIKTFVSIFIFFLLFSAVRFFPLLELNKYSYKIVSEFEDYSDPFLGSQLFEGYIKRLFSMEIDLAYWEHYAFIGHIVPILAILSLLHKSKKKDFLLLMLLFFVFYGMGRYSFFRFIIPYAPLMKNLRWLSRTLQFTSFFAIALASLGFDWFTTYLRKNRGVSFYVFFFSLLFLTATASYTHMMRFEYGDVNSSNFFPINYLPPAIIAFLLVLALGFISGRDLTLNQKCFYYGILAVNVLSLFLANGVFVKSYPSPVNSESAQIFTWLRGYDPQAYSIRVDIPGNSWGVYSYLAYKQGILIDSDGIGAWDLKVAKDRNLTLNKYLISGTELNDTNLELIRRFPNMGHLSFTQRLGFTEVHETEQDFYIYSVLNALPHSFLAGDSNIAPAQIIEFTPNKIVVQAKKENDFGTLVVATNFYPGWKVYIDGGETQDASEWNGLLSTPLKEGVHTYRFTFSPLSFRVGLILTLSSILIMAFLLIREKRNA